VAAADVNRSPRRVSLALALACLLLAALPPTAAYAWVSRVYVDGGYITGGVPYHTIGTDYRYQNVVWRPIGYLFALWYNDGQGQVFNSQSNPFKDARNSVGPTYAYCMAYSNANSIGPVTCQTTAGAP
jgi:hypothetical protein